MTSTYKGHVCATVMFDARRNEYTLFDADGNEVVTLSPQEFLSNPSYRSLPYGRYRSPSSKNNSRADKIPSGTGRDNPYGISAAATAQANAPATIRTSLSTATWGMSLPLRREGI